MKFSLLASLLATLSFVTTAAVAQQDAWSTRLKVHLSNDYGDWNIDSCADKAFVNLKSEMYMWIKDELLAIFGQTEHFALSEMTVVNEDDVLAKRVEFEAEFSCKLCGQKQWSTDRSIHNVAYLLQWFTQLAMDEWRDENEELLEGCMDEDIHLSLFIERNGVEERVYQASHAKFSENAIKTIELLSQD